MSIFNKFNLANDTNVVIADSWHALAAMERGSLIGKHVVCAFASLPFAEFHDPGFRDIPALVSLWAVNGPEAAQQAQVLGLPWIENDASAEQVREKLATLPACASLPLRAPVIQHAVSEESMLARGLRTLGIKQPKPAALTVSIFREFKKPPYGGGNQFMLALKGALEKRGVRVLVNKVGGYIDGYFLDSLWFDEKLLAKLEKIPSPTVVHRIDGPIHLYRGKDKNIDDKIFALNARLATSTVIQSDFTLEKVFETGYRPIRPVVIRNGVNPVIFWPKLPGPPPADRKIRIIAISWSDNPNKGGPIYKWLENHLDWSKFEFTFVGRCSELLTKAKMIAPVASEKLADLIREHDIYLTASQNDPCSNALIEAMSCGLPAIALRSGGHPELVASGGQCFEKPDEIPGLLGLVVKNYESYQRKAQPPKIDDVAESYLALVREP